MTTLLDRYLLRRFIFAYLATFVSMVVLYMVIDIFTKFEEFTSPDPAKVALKEQAARNAGATLTIKRGKPVVDEPFTDQVTSFLRNVLYFYSARIPVFFQRINGVILLLAGAFTLGWMDRQNEMVPILSAGVPMRRLLMPLGAVTSVFLVLAVLDTEFVLPLCSDQLLRQAEDPMGRRPLLVPGTFDSRHVHIEARVAYPTRQMIQHARVTLPSDILGNTTHINSIEMFYHPGTSEGGEHGWIMNGCQPATLNAQHPAIRMMQPGQFFLQTDLSYQRVTRRPNWFLYQSSLSIIDILENEQHMAQRATILGHLHQRMLMPLYDLLLLLLGLPILASRSEWNLFIRIGWCIMIFAVVQGAGMASMMLVRSEMIDPTLAAWLPLLLLGPLVPPVISSMKT